MGSGPKPSKNTQRGLRFAEHLMPGLLAVSGAGTIMALPSPGAAVPDGTMIKIRFSAFESLAKGR